MPQIARTRRKRNRKRPKTFEISETSETCQNFRKFSSEGHAAPILRGVRGAAAPRPQPRRSRRRGCAAAAAPEKAKEAVAIVSVSHSTPRRLTASPKLRLRTGAAPRRSVLSFYNSALRPSDPSDGRIRPLKGPLSGLLSGLQVAWPKGRSWNY